jgi:hypothetical protein
MLFEQSQDYEKLNRIYDSKKLFEDEKFPATVESIARKMRSFDDKQRTELKKCTWKRPMVIFFLLSHCYGFLKFLFFPFKQEVVKNAKFVVKGYERFDIVQGLLGDCWFIASVAGILNNKDLFERVVPQGQDFEKNYNGKNSFIDLLKNNFNKPLCN